MWKGGGQGGGRPWPFVSLLKMWKKCDEKCSCPSERKQKCETFVSGNALCSVIVKNNVLGNAKTKSWKMCRQKATNKNVTKNLTKMWSMWDTTPTCVIFCYTLWNYGHWRLCTYVLIAIYIYTHLIWFHGFHVYLKVYLMERIYHVTNHHRNK